MINSKIFPNTGLKIGLALGGGGPRGLAHIGVIKALEESHIPIDMIAGTSAGSVIGGLYVALGSIAKVERIANRISVKDLLSVFSDVGFASSVIRGTKIEPFLDTHIKQQTIETLSKPFVAVATDLATGNSVEIGTGSLSRAIHASSAVPGLFDSVEYDNNLLVDGGISTPVPVRAAFGLGAGFVIAVNLDTYTFIKNQEGRKRRLGLSSIGIAALNMLQYNLAREQSSEADVTIEPDVASISILNLTHFIKGKDIIKRGYEAAKKVVPEIQKKLKNVRVAG